MESRGAIVGLTTDTDRHDVAKAVLESLTYELALNLEALADAGLVTETVVAAGGGATSPAWVRLKADILGRPVVVPENAEAGGLGAAILAGTAAGLWDPAEAATRLARPRETIDPDPEGMRVYADRLALYREVYPALASIHHRLSAL
jgi:xylulokinase